MPRNYRSRRARLAALRDEMRRQGATWKQVAVRIAAEERVNARIAFRLAHGLSQQQVADRWNKAFPSDNGETSMTDKTVSYWETWPQSGRAPSLVSLSRLAQIYQCDVKDLVESEDYGYLDEATQTSLGARDGEPAQPLVPLTGELQPIPQGAAETPRPVLTDEYAALLLPYLGDARGHGLAALASPQEREIVHDRLVQLLSGWADTVNRREMLRVLGWAACAVAAGPLLDGLNPDEQMRMAQIFGAPGRVDATAIDHIEAVLWRLIRQDDALGAQATIDTILAQRNLIRLILPECPEDLRRRLLSLFSNYSLQAGWLLYDLNDFDSANFYYEHARTTAHEAENTELGALVLCTMSHLATWRGQPRVGIDHAVAAQGWARQTNEPRLRAYAADVAARAFAMDSRRAACLRELASAEANLGVIERQEPEQSRMYFYTKGQYTGTRSLCLLQLHDTAGAIAAGRESMDLVDTSFVRNLAFTKLFLGDAYTSAKAIDEAAKVIGDAAALAVRNRSARLLERLRTARACLTPWRTSMAVRRLDERLRTYRLLPA